MSGISADAGVEKIAVMLKTRIELRNFFLIDFTQYNSVLKKIFGTRAVKTNSENIFKSSEESITQNKKRDPRSFFRESQFI